MKNIFTCEIERNAKPTCFERVAVGILGIWAMACLIAAFTLFAGCRTADCGSKTVVGNHYALPKISNDSSNTDVEVYESTEGAVVYTRRDSKVEIGYTNCYTNKILGIWDRAGVMALKVVIEPLDIGTADGAAAAEPASTNKVESAGK